MEENNGRGQHKEEKIIQKEVYIMLKHKVILSRIVVILIALFLISCANFQQQWGKLTPDEKGRVILNDIQSQLNTFFDQGKAYVASHPECQAAWKAKVIPAFDTVNKAIKLALGQEKEGKFNISKITSDIIPLVQSVVALLGSIGVKVSLNL